VASKRTGIPTDTLRVWERRYGFPSPHRQQSGSRLYSEAEIAKLKLVARALEAGFRPGEVVPLPTEDITRLLEAVVADLQLSENLNITDVYDAEDGIDSARGLCTTTFQKPQIQKLIDALLADDIVSFRSLLRTAAASLGAKGFVVELAQPLAVRVGELWMLGELAVRHEHMASACLTNVLHALVEMESESKGQLEGKPLVILATLPDESHQLPLDMVAVYLTAAQAGVRLLGSDTPPDQIAAAATAMDADVVGISISPVADRNQVEAHVQALLGDLPRKTELWIGGGGGMGIASDVQGVSYVGTWDDLDSTLAATRSKLYGTMDRTRNRI
jgi:MerR family transcriptional regulator, light-induced transcriptional regulator